MSEDASRPRVARHADPIAFLAAAAPVFARDEALASSYVAFATGLLRNPPGETESGLLRDLRRGRGGAAMMRGSGGLWIGASDADAAIAFADDVYAYRGGTRRRCRAWSASGRPATRLRSAGAH